MKHLFEVMRIAVLLIFVLNCVKINFAQQSRFSIEAEKPAGRYQPRDKAIHIQTYLGPFGSAYIPPEILSQQSVFQLLKKGKTELDVEKYFFPSLYFVISAKPNIYISQKNEKPSKNGDKDGKFIDYEFSRGGQSLMWMRVSITLEPVPCKEEYGQELPPTRDADAIKVMAISPEETDELLRESKAAQFARVGDELVNKLIPFVSDGASSPTTAKLSAASGAVSILFKNLFPASAVAYSYAFIDSDISQKPNAGSDTFGWYWRQKNLEQKPESIVGLRRSVAYLQVKRGVKAIKVSYRIDAKWDGDYSDRIDDEYVDADRLPYVDLDSKGDGETIKFDKTYCLPPPTPPNFFEDLEYDFLPHIDNLPMLVPKEIACNIFHKEIAPIFFNADDIGNPRQFLLDLRDTNKPALTLLWQKRSIQILEKLEFKDTNNWNTDVMNLRPDYKLRQMLGEEINILLRDKKSDFYKTMKLFMEQKRRNLLSPTTEKYWKEATTEGSNGKLLLFYRGALNEMYAGSINAYSQMDECNVWFHKEFNGQIVESSGDEFTRRELVKQKLELPTLKEENEALKNMLKPKPTSTP